MPYLVDGNNICGAARDRRLGIPTDEGEMIRLLESFSSGSLQAITAVFDGLASEKRGLGRCGKFGGVEVIYSGRERSADDLIVEIVESLSSSGETVMVSSDRALRSSVRALGSRVMGCRRFAEILGRSADH